jgi:hypothetical protein
VARGCVWQAGRARKPLRRCVGAGCVVRRLFSLQCRGWGVRLYGAFHVWPPCERPVAPQCGSTLLVTLGFVLLKACRFSMCSDRVTDTIVRLLLPHAEVIHFSQKLLDRLEGYGMASEHEHSNCILLARDDFLIDGQWHTWIDYDRYALPWLRRSAAGCRSCSRRVC